jgi:hypothetical protein
MSLSKTIALVEGLSQYASTFDLLTAQRLNKPLDEYRFLIRNEQQLNKKGEAAVAYGLADEVVEVEIPKSFVLNPPPPSKICESTKRVQLTAINCEKTN